MYRSVLFEVDVLNGDRVAGSYGNIFDAFHLSETILSSGHADSLAIVMYSQGHDSELCASFAWFGTWVFIGADVYSLSDDSLVPVHYDSYRDFISEYLGYGDVLTLGVLLHG